MARPQLHCAFAINRIAVRLMVVCMLVGMASVIVDAQDPDDASPRAASPTDGSTEKLRVEVGPNDSVVLIDEKTGQVYLVPAGATVEAFLEWVRQGRQNQNNGQPDYYVSSVSLDGEVSTGDKNSNGRSSARIDVRINIQVLRKEGSVRVPLRLNEATLLAYAHTGSGVPSFLPTERGNGLTCLLSGVGQHQLDLTVSVPVRETGGTQRIQLSLPGSFQSSLQLVVPGMGITVPNESLNARTRQLPDSKTVIQVDGLGASLDLTWQAVLAPRTVKAELQSRTVMSAELGSDGAIIEAAQSITATGPIEALDVELPPGYSFLSVSSPTHKGVQIENAQSNPLRVLFVGSTTGPVELHWELSTAATSDDDPILLGGLRLKDAVRQENWLSVAVADGYRLQRIEAQTRSVRQIRARSFRTLANSRLRQNQPIDQAWQFLSDDARIAYAVDRIAANFRVTPSYDLTFRERRAELAMYLDVQVFNGSLERIPLQWPGFQSEGWQQIEVFGWRRAESENPEPVNILVQAASQENGQVELVLHGGPTSTQGLLQIELHSSRPIESDGKPFALSIPGVDVLPIPIGGLTVTNAASIESILEAGNNTSARLVTRHSKREATSRIPSNQRERTWELNSTNLEFTATTTAHTQMVACGSVARLSFTRDRIHVEQTLAYSVSYAPLSAVRVMVPLPVITAQNAVFRLRLPGEPEASDRELSPESTGLDDESAKQFRLTLPEDMWGEFEIVTTCSLPLMGDAGDDLAVVVPLIQSSDAIPEITRLYIDRPSSIDVRIGDPMWKNELLPGGAAAWIATAELDADAPRYVPLQVQVSAEQAVERFAIQRAVLRSLVRQSGALMEAVYYVAGQPGSLDIRLPSDTDLNSLDVWWDGRLTAFENVARPEHTIRVDLNASPTADAHVLALRFQIPLTAGFEAVNDFTLFAPEFASDVWLAETLWTVTVPPAHHVFVYPDDYAPRFQWVRNGVIWSRQTSNAIRSTADWLFAGHHNDLTHPDTEQLTVLRDTLGQLPFDPLGEVAGFNSYRFSAFGHQNNLTVRTLNHPAIALLGTGLSLIIGLVLLRIPATRHLLSFVVLAFGMALAGLWHMEAVQLLIQPALLGLGLAGIATAIDGWRKREPSVEELAQSVPGDFLPVGPGSSHVELRAEESKPSEPAIV
jgi:hypothetical protein